MYRQSYIGNCKRTYSYTFSLRNQLHYKTNANDASAGYKLSSYGGMAHQVASVLADYEVAIKCARINMQILYTDCCSSSVHVAILQH